MIPRVSILVLNWNGAKHLGRCLEAIQAQTYRDFEIILIDNASTDGSLDGVQARWPEIRLVRLEKNIGFAAANNLGAKTARGEWLALLNNDAFPEPTWLESLITAANQSRQYSFFSSRLMQASQPEIIDGTGDVYHVSGLAWPRERGYLVSWAHLQPGEVFSACAAAALYSRQAFLEAGGFDERYSSHHEDVDLGFRLRLMGHRCLYVPTAVVRHIGSASYGFESDLTVYQVQRNLIWTYVKDMPGGLFWRYLPAHLAANLIFMIYYTLRGKAGPVWRSKLAALSGLPEALRSRKIIQSRRSVILDDIDRAMEHGWFTPYRLGKEARKMSSPGSPQASI